jgi:hypothetical protein
MGFVYKLNNALIHIMKWIWTHKEGQIPRSETQDI